MWWIIVAVLVAGNPVLLHSNQTFDTKEACEAALNGDENTAYSVAKLKVDLAAQGIEVQAIEGKCEVKDGKDA